MFEFRMDFFGYYNTLRKNCQDKGESSASYPPLIRLLSASYPPLIRLLSASYLLFSTFSFLLFTNAALCVIIRLNHTLRADPQKNNRTCGT
jgi:hypothetical protein